MCTHCNVIQVEFSGACRAQVYAYTTSALQSAILRLFVRCEAILPNLFVGTVTRESVLGALKCGLSAEDIVGYLRSHAHPQVTARVPVVPEVQLLTGHGPLPCRWLAHKALQRTSQCV